MYVYRVRQILKVIDGDTVDCAIDLGFGLTAMFRFRLVGINCPELTTAGGHLAKGYTMSWFSLHDDVTVRTSRHSEATVGIGDGAFGRWLGIFAAADGHVLNDDLVTDRHAVVSAR
jgi:micrococcal nuclease